MSRNGLNWRTTRTAGVVPQVTSASVGCHVCGWGADWNPENEPLETFTDNANRHMDIQHPQPPYLGAPVHYRSYGTPNGEYTPQCRAAIVTAVHRSDVAPSVGMPAESVALAVFNPDGIFLKSGIHPDPEHQSGGTWHWPC